MPQPIRRVKTTVDDNGFIRHDDRPVAWIDVDSIAGRRLDRRKSYAVIEGKICSLVSWTGRCSGCTNGLEDRGIGCEECGHHGVVRNSQWVEDKLVNAQ